MSGLFGIVNPVGDIPSFLNSTVARLSHRPWYHADTWVAPNMPLGLGRLGIGIFNTEPQPIRSEDNNIVLFMSGELYETAALRRRLEASGNAPAPRSNIAPELALAAYQSFGPSFAKELNGAFFIAIYDRTQNQLILTNDRFGLYPHYYYLQGDKLVFAPEVKGVLAAPFVPRKLNNVSVAEYMRFQQLFGEKTFHQDISLFPYGSFARFELGQNRWTTERYWDWNQVPDNTKMSFDEALEEGAKVLRRAVERLSTDQYRPGAFLTGGLDSRTIVGLIPPRTPPPVTATFGVHNARDVYYAERIAQAVGSNHHWFDFPNGNWVLENLDLHLKLTEGFHSWMHMHSITMLPKLRQIMDHNLTGWDGGTVMGDKYHIRTAYNQPVDEASVVAESFTRFSQNHKWPGLTEPEEEMLYTPAFRPQMQGVAFDSLRQEFHRFWDFRHDYSAEYFYMVNHVWRFTINMVTTARSHIEVRFPFFDYDLIDFIYSLRPEIRGDQILYRHIITQETPKLARIPYDKQEFLPTMNPLLHKAHALSVRARRRLKVYPVRPTLYADYENYLRNELRSWAEGILYDRRTAERGIFSIPYLHSLMERHISGREQWTIGKIAPLITFEMVMREYFD